MRLVLDSSILVRANDSATGLARHLLLTLIAAGHSLVTSREILHEVSRVLRYPRFQARHHLTDEGICHYIAFILEIADVVTLDPLLFVPCAT